jgi:5-methylcytosine-specific restriction endonuclease McrA
MTAADQKRQYNQAYYAKKRSEILAQKKTYYEQNREACIQRVRDSYDPNEKQKYNQSYREQNRDRLNEYDRNRVRPASHFQRQKEYVKGWRSEKADHIRRVNQEWYAQMKSDPVRYAKWIKDSRERARQGRQSDPIKYRSYGIKRNRRTKNAKGHHTLDQWRARCEYYGYRCAYCHCGLVTGKIHKDHVIPLKKGGTNWSSNLVPACGSCNSSKGIKLWKPRLPF